MKFWLFEILILFLYTECSQNTPNETPTTSIQSSTVNDKKEDTVYVVLPYNEDAKYIFANCKPSDLNENNIQLIDSLLKKCVSEKENVLSINLKEYKRQYIAVTNEKGEKEVWINCFCGSWSASSKKGIFIVLDGGDCFFNLKINLTTKIYYDFTVNGDA